MNCLNVLIRIRKWSKNRGGKHSHLISELTDARMVRVGIYRICLQRDIVCNYEHYSIFFYFLFKSFVKEELSYVSQ